MKLIMKKMKYSTVQLENQMEMLMEIFLLQLCLEKKQLNALIGGPC